jgi:hypothetical protein
VHMLIMIELVVRSMHFLFRVHCSSSCLSVLVSFVSGPLT